MTQITTGDAVVYEVAINEHPLVVKGYDGRSNEKLIESVNVRTAVSDRFDFPGWAVFINDSDTGMAYRYVNTATRLYVRVRHDDSKDRSERAQDVYDIVAEHLRVDGFDMDQVAMSSPNPIHADDFEREVHLDVTGVMTT